jgi:L-lactate dehydrogenase complex protein LldG
MSKQNILNKIKGAKPSSSMQLPDIPLSHQLKGDPVEVFINQITTNAAHVILLDQEQSIQELIANNFPKAKTILSFIPDLKSTIILSEIDHPKELDNLDLAIIPGEVAVADNGAIWVSGHDFKHRVIPYITEQLIITVNRKDIVPHMDQAYERINLTDLGFGVFISGPSKTADIEQALVIGAQGPLGLTVIVI